MDNFPCSLQRYSLLGLKMQRQDTTELDDQVYICVRKTEEMEETLQSDSHEVKLLFNVTALMFMFWQASSHGDGNNSDVNSLSSDMLDIILHEDSCSGTGSAISGSMGSGSNGCGTSASGTSNSGTSKSRNSASGTSGSGRGLFQYLMNILRYLNFPLSQG